MMDRHIGFVAKFLCRLKKIMSRYHRCKDRNKGILSHIEKLIDMTNICNFCVLLPLLGKTFVRSCFPSFCLLSFFFLFFYGWHGFSNYSSPKFSHLFHAALCKGWIIPFGYFYGRRQVSCLFHEESVFWTIDWVTFVSMTVMKIPMALWHDTCSDDENIYHLISF